MRNRASLSIGLCVAVALAAGCATSGTGTLGDDEMPGSSGSNFIHIVAPGDRLSDIALKYTGQIDQWKAIAAYNNITDPRMLRIGDNLTIPASMIPAQISSTIANRESSNAGQSGIAAATPGASASQRTREIRNTQEGTADVSIAPVNTNRTFDLNPIETSDLGASRSTGSRAPQIRVIGSYYPKGVYQQPASYSKLMMRVAPGTTFEVEQEINDWYKVITDQGVGYIRRVDGTLITD